MKKLQFLPIFVLLSCENFEELNQSRNVHHHVVFGGEVDIIQPTDLIVKAGASNINSQERAKFWQNAMTARATATLDVTKCNKINPDDMCVNDEGKCLRPSLDIGSATLNSYTRLVTAFHVTAGSEFLMTATFLRDYINSNRSIQVGEKDWLFMNRLYSLGFVDMARNDIARFNSIKDALKTWGYVVDKDFFIQNNSQYAYDVSTLYPTGVNEFGGYQQLVYVDPNAIEPNDIYVDIYGPGILFDYPKTCAYDPSGYGGQDCSSNKENYELISTHVNEVLNPNFSEGPGLSFKDGRGTNVPNILKGVRQLISEKGFSGQSVPCTQTEVVCYKNNVTGVYEDFKTNYNDNYCISSSLDIKPKSSGGAVMVYDYSGDEQSGGIAGITFYHGTNHAIKYNSSGDINYWTNHVEQSDYVTNIWYNTYTRLSNVVTAQSSIDFFPPVELQTIPFIENDLDFLSSPLFQPEEDGYPEGCDVLSDPKCKDTVPTTTTQHPSIYVDGKIRKDIKKFSCSDYWKENNHQGARIENSFAHGVMGSVTTPLKTALDNELEILEPNLSSIFIICGPWTSAPWTIHWQDLFFTGHKRPFEEILYIPVVYYYQNFILNFSSFLYSMFEIRELDWLSDYVFTHEMKNNGSQTTHHQLRHPSFMMCPPGYALEGLDIITRNCDEIVDSCLDENGDVYSNYVIRGVTAIDCVKVPYNLDDPHEVQSFTLTLHPDPSKLTHYQYESNGSKVDLSQHVGLPHIIYSPGDSQDLFTLTCPQGSAVSGIYTDVAQDPLQSNSPSVFKTTALDIECLPLPRLK